jgi:serine/threonine protein kinase
MDASSPYCPKCGALNPPEAATCFACHESLTALASGPPASASGAVSGPPLPGQLLRNRYRIRRRIGEGGFGAVYQAEDSELGNRRVAIKEMSQYGLRPEELREATDAFHREALLLAGLSHPSLPRIFDHFNEGGRWYLVMEFIEGETLEDGLKRVTGKLSVAKTLELGIKLCNVLEYLHTRQPPIIFRDLKPGNVMVTPTGNVFLIDFGIARLFKPGQSKDTMAFGSPGYAAPEQYGKAQTTPRSDIFSLGALLHHVLSGRDPAETPFRFPPLTWPPLPGLWELIERMVSLDEEKRPATVAVVRQELQRLEAAWNSGRQSAALTTPALSPASTAQLTRPGSSSRAPAPVQTGAHISPSTQTAAPARPPARTGRRSRRKWVGWLIFAAAIFFFGGGPGFVGSTLNSWFGSSPPSSDASTTNSIPTSPVYAVAWSPDSTELAFGGGGHNIDVWSATNDHEIATYTSTQPTITALAWSPDGGYLAAGVPDSSVEVWDAYSHDTVFTYTVDSTDTRGIKCLAWSPDNTRLVSASPDGRAQVWDIQQKKLLVTYQVPGFSNGINAVAWSPNGSYIASASDDNHVEVWRSDTGQMVYTYTGHNGSVKSVAWSPDGTRIASASDDGTVQVWGALDGSNPVVYQGQHNGPVESVVWSPDGSMLASAGEDETVQVWQVNGQPIFTNREHTGTVWAVAWSLFDNQIASASDDGTVLVLDATNGKTLATYPYQP